MTTPEPAVDPLLLDLPETLETARLVLRSPRRGDGLALSRSIQETLADLRRFPSSLPWAMTGQTLASAEAWCRRSSANWILRTDFAVMGFHRYEHHHVVSCGLHRIDWPNRVFEIGWWCRSREQRQGYTAEAASALMAFAFRYLGARRVWCHCDDANEGSWRVAERIGLVLEGVARSERADPDGRRRDMRVYACVR